MRASAHETESALWSLALGGAAIDSSALAAALEAEMASHGQEELDFRTRVLIRDSLNALCGLWGEKRFQDWLSQSPGRDTLCAIWREDLGEVGFGSLNYRVVEATKSETVLQFFRELGLHCPQATRLEIGGAVAVILAGLLSRRTEDVDVVDEIPAILANQHELLDMLAPRYGLRLAHFQSHYLPQGWQTRLHSFRRFGNLEILLVDAYDIFVGKLFSARMKDRDDLRAMARQLDKGQIEGRLRQSAVGLMAEPRLAQFAADNWYILYTEKLPG